jgi:hypothetical protein
MSEILVAQALILPEVITGGKMLAGMDLIDFVMDDL